MNVKIKLVTHQSTRLASLHLPKLKHLISNSVAVFSFCVSGKFQSSFSICSVQSLSRVWLFVTPWNAERQASLSITNSQSLLKFMSIQWWCHPTISSSLIPFSSCLQSFPASGSFPMSPFFTSDSQSIGASASASVLSTNIQDWFPLGWSGLISL